MFLTSATGGAEITRGLLNASNEQAQEKAKVAIAKEDRKQMIEILAASDTKEAAIDSNIKAVEQATEDAKVSYNGKTNAELAAELERRASQ